MSTIFYAFNLLIETYIYIIILAVVLNLLIGFNVVNPYSRLVVVLLEFANRLTEPLLTPIRRFLPEMGGIDLSPLLLLIGVQIFRHFMNNQVFPLLT